MLKDISIIISAILLVVFQLTWLPSFNFNLSLGFNLPLILLIFLIFFFNQPVVIVIAAVSGLLFDLYSPNFFGFYFLLFMFEYAVLQFFTIQILQNKSLFAFISLNVLAVLVWQLTSLIFLYVFSLSHNLNFIQLIPAGYLLIIFYQFITHLILVWLIYKILPVFRHLSAPTLN